MATIERLILDVKSKGRKLSEIKVQAPTEKSQTITEVDDLLKACDSLTTSPDPQMYLADIDPAVLNLRQATAAVNKCFSDRNKPYDQTSKTALKNALNQTVLVGVLGTIVGFYFANNSDSSAARMKLEILKSPGKVQEGMEFEVLAKATGGELPYEANVNIVGAEGLSASGVVDNKSGLITIKSKIVAAAPIKDFPVTIGLKDKSGRLEATTFHVEVEKKQ
jgi:hypothetical protein